MTLVQCCIVDKPEPSQLMTSFIVATAIDESSSTNLNEFCRLMDLTVDDFDFPKLLASPDFAVLGFDKISGSGFCGIEKDSDQVILGVKCNSSFEVVFYGCSLRTGKDVKIIVADENTYLFRKLKNRMKVNHKFNRTFCDCERMTQDIVTCFNQVHVDEVFWNNCLVLLMFMAGVSFLVLLSWVYETFIEGSDVE